MKLWAIADLHVGHGPNREALGALRARPDDWLALLGDTAESPDRLVEVLELLRPRFRRLIWVPGNHDLWGTEPAEADGGAGSLRGVARYEALVEICRRRGVWTPEDGALLWTGPGGPHHLVPVFTLWDLAFRPPFVGEEAVGRWARTTGIRPADERWLDPRPHPTIAAWCRDRLARTEALLASLDPDVPIALLMHFPPRRDLVRIPRIARFGPWCGSAGTEGWLARFPIRVVAYGHLHMRATEWRGGVRYEEVSLGYPRHWKRERGIDGYLRELLPGPEPPAEGERGPQWHR